MKIEDILKKQGEIYKNLTSNKTVQNYNETIEKPKPVKLVHYRNYEILEKEYKAIKGLEKLLNKEPVIVSEPKYNHNFEISINSNQITYLQIYEIDLKQIPEQINNLTSLQELSLLNNQITEIKNLDKLTNLQDLCLYDNKITEIKNLDNLQNLEELRLSFNQISRLENLDNLTNLQVLYLAENQITEIKNLDKLQNLQELYLPSNPIKNEEEAKKLIKKGINVYF